MRYLPTHLTAQEIASELSVSTHTVTTHLRHLYAKLGAHRRHQAVERARALGLLAPAPRGSSGARVGQESQELCDARPQDLAPGSGLYPWEVPVHYQVRVRGRLSEMMLGAFPDLRAQLRGSETVLAGELPDQAALFGVLDRIEALGLELLEVLRTEDH